MTASKPNLTHSLISHGSLTVQAHNRFPSFLARRRKALPGAVRYRPNHMEKPSHDQKKVVASVMDMTMA
jgi:hypothetical protein